jgi:hypothetical protein
MTIQRVEVVTGRGGECATAIYMLTATAKLNDIDPEAWPWNWRRPRQSTAPPDHGGDE